MTYIADLLIFSKHFERHYNPLKAVLQRLNENKLYESPKQFVLLREEMYFSAMLIGEMGIEVKLEKIEICRTVRNQDKLLSDEVFLDFCSSFHDLVQRL